ncbi:hypothetical protein PHMEG_00012123 [Phytophthora megakarya]|uniref:RxLR effector protein n=1 Tax=Phytophthora megakarya TaxID=4795 RepID=A0A225WB04_9STRA|nr:hypothetical protein PHMEG_00012123 [Phytophthora megakarya]
MRIPLTFLMMAVSFLISNKLISSVSADQAKRSQLRGTKPSYMSLTEAEGETIDEVDTSKEDRGIFSSIKYNVANAAKLEFWVSGGKSDNYVIKRLGMDGLTGTALTSHPNYQILQKFRYKHEGRKLDGWLWGDQLTLDGAWVRLGLDKVSSSSVMNTDAYRTYVRFVRKYDDLVYDNGFFRPPTVYGGNDAQMRAKVIVWAGERRPTWYVKQMLQLGNLEKAKMNADPDLTYFYLFLRMKNNT